MNEEEEDEEVGVSGDGAKGDARRPTSDGAVSKGIKGRPWLLLYAPGASLVPMLVPR